MKKKFIMIFGKKVKIKHEDLNPQGLCGYYSHSELIITINSKLPKDMQLQTLLHELFHAMVAILGFNQAQLSQDLEEILADNSANMIMDIFKISFK